MNWIRTFTIHDTDGHWVGDFVLVYDDDKRVGSYFSVTDYGNYSYKWTAVPECGFLQFLARVDAGYMIEKLGMGHDESNVIDVAATRESILAERREAWLKEDADTVGEATAELKRCDTMDAIRRWAWAWDGLLPGNAYYVESHIERTIGGRLRGYRDHVIPRVKAYLREAVNRRGRSEEAVRVH